jgi:hypothetical protein
VYLKDPDGNGIELYYDRSREEWFDPQRNPVLKAEPFDPCELLEEQTGREMGVHRSESRDGPATPSGIGHGGSPVATTPKQTPPRKPANRPGTAGPTNSSAASENRHPAHQQRDMRLLGRLFGSLFGFVAASTGARAARYEARRNASRTLQATQRGKPPMTNTLAHYTDELWEISRLSTESALPRAARFLADLMADPAFVGSQVLPLIEETRDAEDWYVARRHGGEDDAYSLKLFVWPVGTGTKIHDHSSWGAYACAAGSVLEERYDRLDDGSLEEHARLKKAWQLWWAPRRRGLDGAPGRRRHPPGGEPRRGPGRLGAPLRPAPGRDRWPRLRPLPRLRLRPTGD